MKPELIYIVLVKGVQFNIFCVFDVILLNSCSQLRPSRVGDLQVVAPP